MFLGRLTLSILITNLGPRPFPYDVCRHTSLPFTSHSIRTTWWCWQITAIPDISATAIPELWLDLLSFHTSSVWHVFRIHAAAPFLCWQFEATTRFSGSPHMQQSHRFKSGDLVGHFVGPRRPIHRTLKILSGKFSDDHEGVTSYSAISVSLIP
jgi:hypothetical protein